MNTRGHLQILCALFLAFCNEFAHGRDEISGAEFLKFAWGKTRHRRGLRFVRDANIKDAGLTPPETKPHFECGDGVLAVLLKHADVINTQIYGLQGELLHLPQLAVFCGVSIKPTPTHLHLLFNYDSCYVKKEEAAHVLSLSWYGTDFVLPCPVHVPPSVRCKNGAMEMTVVHGTAEVLSVALNEKWTPLLDVATNCWQREHSNKRRHTFSIPFSSCGVYFRDGRYVLHLKSKDKLMVLSCPYDPVLYSSQSLQQGHPGPRGFNPKAISSEAVKQVYTFAAENEETNAARTLPLHPRSYWLPKMPPLPGNFNLSVSFPFSVPLPKHHERFREEIIFVPEPTPTPTPTPTPSTTSSYQEIPDIDENYQYPNYVSYEQMERDRFPLDNFPPYMRYPYKHHRRSHLNSVLANIAQYLPPGYFICSNNDQEPPVFPPTFPPLIPNPALQNQNPGSIQFAPVIPVLPMNGYTDRQMTRPVASSIYDSSASFYQPNRRFQSSQYQPYFYQGSYGHRGSSTGSLIPNAPLVPVNLQSQANYPIYPVPQDSRPYQTDGDQSLNPYQGSVFQTHRRLYRPSQLSNFPNSPMNLEVVSADVYTDRADSSPKGFFQARSIDPVRRQRSSLPTKGED